MDNTYVARPTTPGPHPLVLVGFEMFGVTDYIRQVADRLAGAGYLAVVPDFYHGVTFPETAEGRAAGLAKLRDLTGDGVVADVRSTVRRHGDGTPVAMVGVSAGAHLGYYAASRVPMRALAAFYPGWLTDTTLRLSPGPVLGLTPGIAAAGTRLLVLLGEDDHLYTAAGRADLAGALGTDLVVYPHTPHGFFCHTRSTYRPAEADDAWRRVMTLLRG